MVRLVIRFFGLLALAGAFVALVIDGTRSVAAGSIALLPLGRTCAALAPETFLTFHTIVEARLPLVWDPILVTILLLPTWLVFGASGMVLLALTRRPMPKIGYSRR